MSFEYHELLHLFHPEIEDTLCMKHERVVYLLTIMSITYMIYLTNLDIYSRNQNTYRVLSQNIHHLEHMIYIEHTICMCYEYYIYDISYKT